MEGNGNLILTSLSGLIGVLSGTAISWALLSRWMNNQEAFNKLVATKEQLMSCKELCDSKLENVKQKQKIMCGDFNELSDDHERLKDCIHRYTKGEC